jgi:hypothetical protein
MDEIILTEEEKANQDWLDAINAEADEKATELSAIFNCEVKPFVFVVEPLKDAAVGFMKVPDAKQSFKLMREMAISLEAGVELAAKAQLIRMVGEDRASDIRFMDENGNYDAKNSTLNFSLLLKAQTTIALYQDAFKKK